MTTDKQQPIADKIEYRQEGEVLIPILEMPEEQNRVGKYGRMRFKYLKEHDRGEYTRLSLKMEMNQHLVEVDQQAREMIDKITLQLLETDPAPDKAKYQMEWVGHMNRIKAQAEEIILHELIYR